MISHKQIDLLFGRFRDVNAMVIGDVMIDAYLYGDVERISPEAPVPVVSLTKRINMLGGAANVALNVKALGAVPLLFSVIGTDLKGSEFLELLEKENMYTEGIIQSAGRITTTKFRIIGNKSQMLRVDEEIITDLDTETEDLLLENISRTINQKNIHVIILQDYNKGVLTKRVIESVIKLADEKHIPVVVDPKKKNFDAYKGVKLFKPNLKELKEGLKTDFPTSDQQALFDSIALFQDNQMHEMIMVTLGDKGMVIGYMKDGQRHFYSQAAHVRTISDVSGAGDTVISVAALCLVLDCDVQTITFLSNLAGGIVCEHVGVVPIDKERLMCEARALANSDTE